MIYRAFGKRAVDLLGALVGLIVGFPLMLVVGVAVFASGGFPVFFRQPRPGKGGVVFRLLKFRTMNFRRDAKGDLLSDADRLTGFGRFLRASSLDELPELVNVLRGDMSLVGPRPLLVEYLPLYDTEQRRRHEVRPGLTGLAQVSGRNSLTWEERFALDVRYVEEYSFMLDLKVIFSTLGAVVRREGITARDSATMPAFRGSPRQPES